MIFCKNLRVVHLQAVSAYLKFDPVWIFNAIKPECDLAPLFDYFDNVLLNLGCISIDLHALEISKSIRGKDKITIKNNYSKTKNESMSKKIFDEFYPLLKSAGKCQLFTGLFSINCVYLSNYGGSWIKYADLYNDIQNQIEGMIKFMIIDKDFEISSSRQKKNFWFWMMV